MSSNEKVTLPFGVVPLVLGFGLLLTGIILLFFSSSVDSTATGSVTKIDQGMLSSGRTRCSLNATFTVQGKTYVASSLDSSPANCKFQVGDAVPIKYNSANPAVNQIPLGYLSPLGVALTAGGALLLALGGVLLARGTRKGTPLQRVS